MLPPLNPSQFKSDQIPNYPAGIESSFLQAAPTGPSFEKITWDGSTLRQKKPARIPNTSRNSHRALDHEDGLVPILFSCIRRRSKPDAQGWRKPLGK